jgi:hypothetical protein
MPKYLVTLIMFLKFTPVAAFADALEKAFADGKLDVTDADDLVVASVEAARQYVPHANINELELVKDVALAVGKYEDSQALETPDPAAPTEPAPEL